MDAASIEEAVALCVCQEQVSDQATPWLIDDVALQELKVWWKKRITCNVDPHMGPEVYLDMVSR